jgi:hypothetical protein
MLEHFWCGYVGLHYRDDSACEGHVTKTAEIRLACLFTTRRAVLRLHVQAQVQPNGADNISIAAGCFILTYPHYRLQPSGYYMYRQV